MLFKRASALDIRATAFRDDRSAEAVTITDLSFDRCRLSTRARFEVGERLRLHLAGQGLIEIEVQWVSGDRVGAALVRECHV
jgi:hypothetical protein